jgi:hypothetical protein
MLSFETSSPNKLLENIRRAIDKNIVVTWTYDADGDFIHAPPQWANKAWLRPSIVGTELRLNIVPPLGARMSKEIYGIYHGRFTEMMLVHFDLEFESVASTALASIDDIVAA